MKKKIAMLLAAALCMGTFAGCGNSASNDSSAADNNTTDNTVAATSIICRALELLPQVSLAHTLVRLLIYMIVLFVLYVIVVLVFRYALHASDSILRKIGMAAFNTLVLAIPVINRSAAYTVGESLGAGLGAGAAFALAVFLIHAGIHVLDRNDKIPKAFQGTPALFIYVSLLALAFTGFSGRSLFI